MKKKHILYTVLYFLLGCILITILCLQPNMMWIALVTIWGFPISMLLLLYFIFFCNYIYNTLVSRMIRPTRWTLEELLAAPGEWAAGNILLKKEDRLSFYKFTTGIYSTYDQTVTIHVSVVDEKRDVVVDHYYFEVNKQLISDFPKELETVEFDHPDLRKDEMVLNKESDDRQIGFIQGVAYAAGLVRRFGSDSEQIFKESGITEDELRKYVDDYDLENFGQISQKD